MKQICEKCKHYIQHYIQYDEGYGFVYCGHCCYPRLKHRKPDTPACAHYKEKAEAPCKPAKTVVSSCRRE